MENYIGFVEPPQMSQGTVKPFKGTVKYGHIRQVVA